MKSKSITKKVAVIGSEIEALKVSKELVKLGYPVTIISRESSLGGSFINEKIKPTGIDAEYSQDPTAQIKKIKNINYLQNAKVTDLSGHFGDYTLYVKNGSSHKIKAGAIVVTGSPVYAYSETEISDNYMPLYMLEKMLDPQGATRGRILSIARRTPASIAFFLNDKTSSRFSFCKILDYAFYLKTKVGVEISIIVPHLLVAADNIEENCKKARDIGINIIKYTKTPKIDYRSGNNVDIIFSRSEDIINKISVELTVYLPETSRDPYVQELSSLLKIRNYPNINYMSSHTSRMGVFLCGRARDDLLYSESLIDAAETAVEIDNLLHKVKISYKENVVLVDKVRCTFCITCVRACPHGAIEMRRDVLQERVVNIIAEDCRQCGTCVGECPAKALTFKDV